MLDSIADINNRLAAEEISVEQAVRSTIALMSQGVVTYKQVLTESDKRIVEQIDNVSLRIAEDL